MTAQVIYLRDYQEQLDQDRSEKRALARSLLYEAAKILSEVGPQGERVSWLIEDCADYLLTEPNQSDRECLKNYYEQLEQLSCSQSVE